MKAWNFDAEFRETFGRCPDFVARAPGRVNLIGEHTDYNSGLVLPMAIDRRVEIWFSPRNDKQVNLFSANFGQSASFSLDEPITKDPKSAWCDYIKGVANVLISEGHELVGFDALIFGDIPLGSGLSSSAAIEVAAVLAFAHASSFELEDALTIAKLAQRAEREFVGVNCGLMDQFISAAGQQGHAMKIDCADMSFVSIKMHSDVSVIVGDTKLSRSLAASAYNERRSECEQALDLIKTNLPQVQGNTSVQSMRDISVSMVESSRSFLPDTLLRRCRHVATENERVIQAANALQQNNNSRVGQLLNDSHASLRDDYEVSSDGLNSMVDCMRLLPGCFGARLTGAGFGGCAIALVDSAVSAEFTQGLLELNEERNNTIVEVYPTIPSDGGKVFALN